MIFAIIGIKKVSKSINASGMILVVANLIQTKKLRYNFSQGCHTYALPAMLIK